MTLTERITALQQQRDQTVAALNQVLGAIAILEQMQKEKMDAKTAAEKPADNSDRSLPLEPLRDSQEDASSPA